MKNRKFLCPQCQNTIEEFYIPESVNILEIPELPVCRCPICDAFIDDQIQAMLDKIIEEETLKELIWQERARLVKAIDNYDDLVQLWDSMTPPPEDSY